jgi:hypothetical protein
MWSGVSAYRNVFSERRQVLLDHVVGGGRIHVDGAEYAARLLHGHVDGTLQRFVKGPPELGHAQALAARSHGSSSKVRNPNPAEKRQCLVFSVRFAAAGVLGGCCQNILSTVSTWQLEKWQQVRIRLV